MSFAYWIKVSAPLPGAAPVLASPRCRRPGGLAGTRGSLLELPLLPAHGAVLLDLLRVQPLEDAVHVEAVRALAPNQRAVVTGHLACIGDREGEGSHGAQGRSARRSQGCHDSFCHRAIPKTCTDPPGEQLRAALACQGYLTRDARETAPSQSRCPLKTRASEDQPFQPGA